VTGTFLRFGIGAAVSSPNITGIIGIAQKMKANEEIFVRAAGSIIYFICHHMNRFKMRRGRGCKKELGKENGRKSEEHDGVVLE
jgi:hypothetical protein